MPNTAWSDARCFSPWPRRVNRRGCFVMSTSLRLTLRRPGRRDTGQASDVQPGGVGMHVDWELREQRPAGAQRTVLPLPGGMCSASSYAEVMAEPELANVNLIAATFPGQVGTPPPDDCSVENYARLASELAVRSRSRCCRRIQHGCRSGSRDGHVGCVRWTGGVARGQPVHQGRARVLPRARRVEPGARRGLLSPTDLRAFRASGRAPSGPTLAVGPLGRRVCPLGDVSEFGFLDLFFSTQDGREFARRAVFEAATNGRPDAARGVFCTAANRGFFAAG